jgi:GGDEF domain-containing protein
LGDGRGQHHRVRREEFLVLREQRRTNALLVDEVERRGARVRAPVAADHDPLTGVPNRRALLRLAEQAALLRERRRRTWACS